MAGVLRHASDDVLLSSGACQVAPQEFVLL